MSKLALWGAGAVALTGAVVLPLAISMGAFASSYAEQSVSVVLIEPGVTGGPDWPVGSETDQASGHARVQP
ncbi:MAG: hypothetical protein ACXIVO_02425 [Glycocaulis sp.]